MYRQVGEAIAVVGMGTNEAALDTGLAAKRVNNLNADGHAKTGFSESHALPNSHSTLLLDAIQT